MKILKNHTVITLISLAVASVVGYFIYKAVAGPVINAISADWLNGYANFTVDGNIVLVKKGESVILPDVKYSIVFENTTPARVVLLKNGLLDTIFFTQ